MAEVICKVNGWVNLRLITTTEEMKTTNRNNILDRAVATPNHELAEIFLKETQILTGPEEDKTKIVIPLPMKWKLKSL